MVRIAPDVEIASDELTFTASRSSGPGGQHVNKTSSRITLRFDLEGSPSLSAEHKARIRERLPGRINKDGVLSVSSQKHRSQSANRDATVERFQELLAAALDRPTPRRATRTPRRARERRLQDKKRRSQLKRQRSESTWTE